MKILDSTWKPKVLPSTDEIPVFRELSTLDNGTNKIQREPNDDQTVCAWKIQAYDIKHFLLYRDLKFDHTTHSVIFLFFQTFNFYSNILWCMDKIDHTRLCS